MNREVGDLANILILNLAEVKTVSKPWGWEKWIANGEQNFPYALKEIFIKANHRTSIQFHKCKQETNYITQGKCILHYSSRVIDSQKYENNEYSQEAIEQLISDLVQRELDVGAVFHIFPGFIHRVEAVEDLTMIEVSSIHLDDVYRLRDDTQRGHGRIEDEHHV